MSSVFLAGGSGFIGAQVIRAFVAAGLHVAALARSERSAHVVAAAGAEPVDGDLRWRGSWQDVVRRAEYVVDLAQPPTFGARVTRERARAYGLARAQMDELLFSSLSTDRLRKVVYVAGTSVYGDLGTGLCDETTTPRPRGFGPYLAPAVLRAEAYPVRLPLVTAFPGYVYGDGSWCREYVLEPLRRGQRIHVLRGRSRYASCVHVHDCARAIVHLTLGSGLGRYFLVDDEPVTWNRFYARAAQAFGVPLRTRAVPVSLMRALIGDVVTESLLSDAALSNSRLKRTGFALQFPSSALGLADVVAHDRLPHLTLQTG